MSDERLLQLMLVSAASVSGVWAMNALASSKPPGPEVWYELHFGRDVDESGVRELLRFLASDHRRFSVALEVVGHAGTVHYRIGLPEANAPELLARLTSFVPSVATERINKRIDAAPTRAWKIGLSSSARPLRTDHAESVARAILAALVCTNRSETIILQWLLGPRLRATTVRKGQPNPAASWGQLLKAATIGEQPLDHDQRVSINKKVEEVGFRCLGRIAVSAGVAEAEQSLTLRLLAALRMVESPGVRITIEPERTNALNHALRPKRFPLPLNISELTTLLGWPLGSAPLPGMNREGARALRPSDAVTVSSTQHSAVSGLEREKVRVIGESAYPGDDRKVVLPIREALQHLHVLGPTGVGKSTLLLGLITQDMAAGHGVIVIDPKGDLISDVLARVPRSRMHDVVLLDPTDEACPVGLNVLATSGRSPELVADQVLAVFHGLYKDSWGPRTQDILHACLLTLAGRPNVSLVNLPLLLSSEKYRREVTKDLTDEIALKPFWYWFENISEAERLTATAPLMNKLRAFLLRPRMRAVLGQAEPRFDLRQVFEGNKILLVSLAKGTLGPEAAALLGSLVVSQIWQAVLGRVAIPSSQRSPVMAYIDEFQDYLHLPTDLADVLAQARGLGLGLTLAHQHLGQLSPNIREAVLANARSRVCFQLAAGDAKAMATAHPGLAPEDFMSLPRYQAYASLASTGAVSSSASIRTVPASEPLLNESVVRTLSRRNYGRPLSEVEAELRRLLDGNGESGSPVQQHTGDASTGKLSGEGGIGKRRSA